MKKNDEQTKLKIKIKPEKVQLVSYIILLVSLIVPIIYLIFKMIFGTLDKNDAGYHSDADYVLMIVQCLLGIVAINIPTILAKRFRFEVPAFLYIFYIFFLWCSIVCGEVASFYYLIPWWDSFLHASSSLMLGFFGFMVITILNRDEHIIMTLSPFFICLFAFCFAVTVGALWEIYEFTFDGILGLNMQKFMLSDGTPLVGHEALKDTMKDIITDALGALVATIVGYIGLKKNKKWLIPKITEDEKDKVGSPYAEQVDTEKADNQN